MSTSTVTGEESVEGRAGMYSEGVRGMRRGVSRIYCQNVSKPFTKEILKGSKHIPAVLLSTPSCMLRMQSLKRI